MIGVARFQRQDWDADPERDGFPQVQRGGRVVRQGGHGHREGGGYGAGGRDLPGGPGEGKTREAQKMHGCLPLSCDYYLAVTVGYVHGVGREHDFVVVCRSLFRFCSCHRGVIYDFPPSRHFLDR